MIKANDETVAWVAFSDFKSARISWINDKLLYLDCNIGHVPSVDAILDVENLKWIYRGSKSYNRQVTPSIVGK